MTAPCPTTCSFVHPDRELGLRLLPVARRIFSETFAHLYDHKVFEEFCDYTYSPDGPMARDLADPAIRWRVATFDHEPIGYAKLTPLRTAIPEARQNALELQQIYVLARWHGQGVAEALMHWALETARSSAAPELYLTVFDHNERAKRFYTRHGFVEVGRCTFSLGGRVDEDRVWRKTLNQNTSSSTMTLAAS
jgi:GNAT superfamily N-acetyltransferase